MEKIIFAWSSGKDSAMALYELKKRRDVDVVALLTTVTEDYDRVSMHGVPRILVQEQALSIGLPLEKVYISKKSSNEEYEARMSQILTRYKELGIRGVAFGDIFLEELKSYREQNLAKLGLKGIFPIWKRDTKELARAFIDLGFKAVITCVDSKVLDGSFSGREFDMDFLTDLPDNIDPCGENGEFHSFVYDGPLFKKPITFAKGDIVVRDERFHYCDLVLPQALNGI